MNGSTEWNIDDSEDIQSSPSPSQVGADMEITQKYREKMVLYPYRVFTDSSEDPMGAGRVINLIDSIEIATLLYLEAKLEHWELPTVRHTGRGKFDEEMSFQIQEDLRARLDRVDPDLTIYDLGLYASYTHALRRTLKHIFIAASDDPILRSLLARKDFSLKDFRPDLFLTFLSKMEVREKVSALLGDCWLRKMKTSLTMKNDEVSLLPLNLPRRVADEIYSRLTCLVEGARVVPALASMITLHADDHQLLKGNMACMGEAKGMYMIIQRPARQFEKHAVIAGAKGGVRVVTTDVVQPLHTPIEEHRSVGNISLKNLPEKSCVVARVPINCISSFSLKVVFHDYEGNEEALEGVRIKIIMIDEPDMGDDDIFESTTLTKDVKSKDNKYSEYDGIAVREMPGPESYFTVRNVETLQDIEHRYCNTPWFKELQGLDHILKSRVNVTELDLAGVKGQHIAVDLKEHGVFLGDADGDLMLLEPLEDIVQF